MKHAISRRTMLKGLGTAIALPMLEGMTPAPLLAGLRRQAPLRMAFLYVPNGVHMQDWTPSSVGSNFKLPYVLEPLKAFQEKILVLSGLTLDKARANGDGGGDHARAMSAFLTGRQPRKTHGADIRVGISVDQIAAGKVGKKTRFASLELGCEQGQQAGNCDTGYSCAYSSNLSWRTESAPMAKEINPRSVFERLFSNQNKKEVQINRGRRERYQSSILDFVMEDANDLRAKLGIVDQRKIDEYLTSIREIENRLARSHEPGPDMSAGFPKPNGIPTDYEQHLRLMCDMWVVAFQGDLTRIATLVFANDGSNRSYRAIGVPEGHHELSHHGGDKNKQQKIRSINRFHVKQLAYLMQRLNSISEDDGTLLDHCMIVYGSGISDGNRHNHDELPILLAGKGNRTLQAGRHIRYPKETPLTNLYLSMLDRMEVKLPSFGDSTGRLSGLTV